MLTALVERTRSGAQRERPNARLQNSFGVGQPASHSTHVSLERERRALQIVGNGRVDRAGTIPHMIPIG